MPTNKIVKSNPGLARLHSDLPTVPEAFRRTDYEGVIEEIVKGIQLRRYQKTQAERIAVLKQINQIQKECLALAQNEADWRHFDQEERLRQKRLDVHEMELDQRMEDLVYERERKILERSRTRTTAASPTQKNPVEEITAQLAEAIRAEAGIKDAFDKARAQHPDIADWLDELEARVKWDLREKKWF